MPILHEHDSVLVLDLGDDENRFNPDWLKSVNSLLDDVESRSEPTALVTTGSGKFYSNGLDLGWLTEHPDQAGQNIAGVHELLARMLAFPVATVAAVNGHAFGAGAMLAMAHDFRVMRADRGFFCFPEADINIPFTAGMSALIQAKLTPAAAIASMTTARRFGGADARHIGLVDEVAAQDELAGRAGDLVRPLAGKDRATVKSIKSTMFAPALAALTDHSNASISLG